MTYVEVKPRFIHVVGMTKKHRKHAKRIGRRQAFPYVLFSAKKQITDLKFSK